MKTALLFPGQGAQFVGMGQDIIQHHQEAQRVFKQLPSNLRQLITEGPIDELSDTRYTQPAIFGVSMAILEILKDSDIAITGVAGLSLGEYSALCAAGAFSVEAGLKIVSKRAQLMYQAVSELTTTMLAVIGINEQQLQRYMTLFLEQYPHEQLMIANYNTEIQQVVAGTLTSIDKFKRYLRQQGIKSMLLKVSGPFHTPLLEQASQLFLPYLEQVDFKQLNYQVYSNVDAQSYREDSPLARQLANQISQPVYFYQMIQQMLRDGYERFIEIGPGTVLSKFVKQIAPGVTVNTVNNLEDLIQLNL